MKDENVYIIKKYPDNKTGVSKSRIYDMNHLHIYMEEMEIGEKVIIKKGKNKIEFEKNDVIKKC